jgi:hypothetical protein
MQWTTGSRYFRDYGDKNTDRMYLGHGRTYVVKLRLAGEPFLDRLKMVVGK